MDLARRWLHVNEGLLDAVRTAYDNFGLRSVRRLPNDLDLISVRVLADDAPDFLRVRSAPARKPRREVDEPRGAMASCARRREAQRMKSIAVRARRVVDAPIIHPGLDESIGDNIQGPSLIRVPDWFERPLGRYYLYFADHKGAWIRLAHADALAGPWRVHAPGSLRLEDSWFLTQAPEWTEAQAQAVREALAARGVRFPHDPILDMTVPHIASPDVHVDQDARRIRMYYHGLERFAEQMTRVALSSDGLRFEAREEVLGPSYFRTFRLGEFTIAMAMPGRFYRSRDPLSGFEAGPRLFGPTQRHAALLLRGDLLYVFHSNVGDAPERILVSTIDVRAPFEAWQASEAVEVLRPERPWEGAELPLVPSLRSVAPNPVNQLRDPAVFEEDGRTFLLYAVAGEAGIGLAELEFGD